MNILLCSVFKPYGVDDEFGEADNRMELFHNQVTREQEVFSMRMSHHSGGLHLIAANVLSPVVVLDFPTLPEFEREIQRCPYDLIGISFIVPNVLKAKRMVESVRRLSPQSRVIVGGHGAAIEDVASIVRSDEVCRGEGVSWLRTQLGEDPKKPMIHPVIADAVDRRILGMPVPATGRVFMPGVGCPNRCDFCSTSHFFGGVHHPFWSTGEALFRELDRIAIPGRPTDFWVLDENFLKFEDRVRELAALVARSARPWSFGLFSSAEAVQCYDPDFLVEMGVRFLWIGMESTLPVYGKNRNTDFPGLVRMLQSRGISVLISTILFLDEHDHNTIQKDIDATITMGPDLIQFMELGPLPGTSLYRKLKTQNRLSKRPYTAWHGQGKIWHRHPVFSAEESHRILVEAFRKDFLENGPSILRMARTYLAGLVHLKSLASTKRTFRMRLAMAEDRCRKAQMLLPTCEALAPSVKARDIARETSARYRETLGPLDPVGFAMSRAILASAHIEKRRIAQRGDVLQPSTVRTLYRSQCH